LSNSNADIILNVIICGVVLTNIMIGDLYELVTVADFSLILVSLIGRLIVEFFIRLRKYLRILLQLSRTRFSLTR